MVLSRVAGTWSCFNGGTRRGSPQGPTGRWRVLLVSSRLQQTPGRPLPPTPAAWPAKAMTVPGVHDPQGRALHLSMGSPALPGAANGVVFLKICPFFFPAQQVSLTSDGLAGRGHTTHTPTLHVNHFARVDAPPILSTDMHTNTRNLQRHNEQQTPLCSADSTHRITQQPADSTHRATWTTTTTPDNLAQLQSARRNTRQQTTHQREHIH